LVTDPIRSTAVSSGDVRSSEISTLAFPGVEIEVVGDPNTAANDEPVLPAVNLADILNDNQQFTVENFVEQFDSDTALPNYFSAFSLPADDEEFEETFEDTSEGNIDEEVEQDVASESPVAVQQVEPMTASRPLFDASTAFSNLPVSSVSESFFAGRPTDVELLALEDEAVQYDSMGVWENDPPLEVVEEIVKPPVAGARAAGGSPAPTARMPENLFGDDFDEEVAIPANAVSPLGRGTSGGSGELAAEVADYLNRIQAFADAMGQASGDAATVDQVIAAGATAAEANVLGEAWQVDTVAVDEQNALQIASDIEDLVSQLNFSAFSVEPYSVEQISLDAPQASRVPEDSVRAGDNAEIYMLHRAQGAESRSIFEASGVDYDDDRDLLIIEEDLPVSSKMTDQLASEKNETKISPYNQLFARLRK